MGQWKNLETCPFFVCRKTSKAPNLLISMGMGMTAGAVGSFVGNPSELILIRMTADGRLPVAERRNYTGFFNALFRIAREEGKGASGKGFSSAAAC